MRPASFMAVCKNCNSLFILANDESRLFANVTFEFVVLLLLLLFVDFVLWLCLEGEEDDWSLSMSSSEAVVVDDEPPVAVPAELKSDKSTKGC